MGEHCPGCVGSRVFLEITFFNHQVFRREVTGIGLARPSEATR